MKNFFTQLDVNVSQSHRGLARTLEASSVSRQSQRGFSLVETIVAMAILLVSITGIMNLIHQGSAANRQQADQITATYLAAEAIEYLRADRDSYWLQSGGGNGFNDWINSADMQNCQLGEDGCRIDARVGYADINQCVGACDPLDYNTETGEYGYETGSAWEESRFRRYVTIATANSLNEAQITVTVTWQTAGAGQKEVVLEQSIYDYREN